MFDRQIHLVRHGETVWNRARRFQGHTDVPLSDEGVEQARLAASRLRAFPIAYAYSSDLRRAFETARPIADAAGVPLEAVYDLREANKGELEGAYRDPKTGLIGDDARYHDENDVDARPPGGESMVDLRERCQRFMAYLQEQEPGLPPGDILLTSHGGTLRALMTVLLDLPIEAGRSFHFDNCSLTSIQFRGSLPPLMTRFNDTQHLTLSAANTERSNAATGE